MKSQKNVYLDHNATTPVRKEALSVFSRTALAFGNPSSVHWHGRQAREIMEQARNEILNLLGLTGADYRYKLVFTSSGTESNHLALEDLKNSDERYTIIISPAEHSSILKQIPELKKKGHEILSLPFIEGQPDLNWLEDNLKSRSIKRLILQTANNETGIVYPVEDIASLVTDYNTEWHADTVQTLGKIKVNYRQLNAKSLTISSHKIYGLKGTAALIYRGRLKPLFNGGGQESGLRSGTENTPGIAAFAEAVNFIVKNETEIINRQLLIRQRIEEKLKLHPDRFIINGTDHIRLANTISLALHDLDAAVTAAALDSFGFSVSTGAACNSGTWDYNANLVIQGIDRQTARSSIRISTGIDTSESDIDRFFDALMLIYDRSDNLLNHHPR